MSYADLALAARLSWEQTFDEQDDWRQVFAERRTLDRTPIYAWLHIHADGESWLAAAAAGDRHAQWLAGLLCQYAFDDERQAIDWYEKAAFQEDATAAFALSQLIVGLNQINWLQYAADHGNARAQYTLSRHFIMGEGVPKNRHEGLKWLRKAAENGYHQAQFALASHFTSQGDGETASETALYWYEKAATQGHIAAAQQLAELRQR